MQYCDFCGSEIRWVRETPSFSVRTGAAGHSYHLKCVLHGRLHWHDSTGVMLYQNEPPVQGLNGSYENVERVPSDDPRLTGSFVDLGVGSYGGSRPTCRHYDSHSYRWVEGDRESYANGELP